MISLQEKNMPEGEISPSGYSVNPRNVSYIDNDKNVVEYEYRFHSKENRESYEYTLSEKEYIFLEEIRLFEDDEYPQGLCITDEFILISSYSDSKDKLGELKVFDRVSGEFLISLCVDENSHLGGVAYDGEYVWICNSNEMALERISYAYIKQLVYDNLGKKIDVRNQVDMYRVKNKPSSVACYGGYILVSSHSILTPGNMIGYIYNQEKDKIEAKIYFEIPPKVQGVTFTERGEVIVSISYGRKSSSYVKKYHSLLTMSKDINNYKECIELPPCSEGIFFYDDNLYILFESAAKKYLEGTDGRGESLSPLDKILMIRMEK